MPKINVHENSDNTSNTQNSLINKSDDKVVNLSILSNLENSEGGNKKRKKEVKEGREDDWMIIDETKNPEMSQKNPDKEIIIMDDKTVKENVLQFLRNNTDLYMMIICFESLNLDSLYKRICETEIVITKPKLLEILDSEHFFVSCGLDAKIRKKENKKLGSSSRTKKRR